MEAEQPKKKRGRPSKAEVAAREAAKASGTSSAPSSLPPAQKMPRPPPDLRTLERAIAALEKIGATEPEKPEAKLLPEDPDELEKSIRLAKLPARIPVMCVDESFQAFGLRGLTPNEKEEGIHAWAALFWEWGLYRSGKVLVALWTMGVCAPRFIDWYEARQERKKGIFRVVDGAQQSAPQQAQAAPNN